MKHWIEVGEECLKMNNFDTLMAITNGIESTPVSRLYNTWEVCLLSFFLCCPRCCAVVSLSCFLSLFSQLTFVFGDCFSQGINKAYLERFLQLKKAISSEANYSAYRNKLKTVQTPCIPFLGECAAGPKQCVSLIAFSQTCLYLKNLNSPHQQFAT